MFMSNDSAFTMMYVCGNEIRYVDRKLMLIQTNTLYQGVELVINYSYNVRFTQLTI